MDPFEEDRAEDVESTHDAEPEAHAVPCLGAEADMAVAPGEGTGIGPVAEVGAEAPPAAVVGVVTRVGPPAASMAPALHPQLFPEPEASPTPEPGPPAARRPRPAFPIPRIVAMANQKGGVGKTTTTLNLASSLAELGRRILVVDFDPQGGCALGLGVNPNELDLTVYNLVLQEGVTAQDVLVKTSVDGLDLIPSNIDLAAAELLLVQEVARELTLRRALQPLKAAYDFIFIDCPPSLGLLTVNALTAADTVIIPLECEYFALRGMSMLLNTVEKIQERLNSSLRVEGILPTMYDARTLHCREVLERVGEAFGDLVFETRIPKTIRFAEAPVVGKPITEYASGSRGAESYRSMAREVLGA